MGELLIKNGFVFDPLQGIKGDRMDIGVKDGKIVEHWDMVDLASLFHQLGILADEGRDDLLTNEDA